jgi:hypothetical protein
MADLDPTIRRLPPTTPTSPRGQARGRFEQPGASPREGSTTGHGDSAVLSAAGRAALDREPAAEGPLTAEQALATAAHAAESSVSIAGAAHTAAIMRGARLLR